MLTSILLDKTMEIILRRIYNCNETITQIPKKVMKELFLLFTKKVHFGYSNEIYQQIYGVAMGSPLVPVLAGIFIVELETSVIPTLFRWLLKCKRYVDSTICYVRIGIVDDGLKKLNGFHQNI